MANNDEAAKDREHFDEVAKDNPALKKLGEAIDKADDKYREQGR